MENKNIEFLTSLQKELKECKDEKVIIKKLEEHYGKNKISSMLKDNLYYSLNEEDKNNPLYFLAKENSAIRALKESILKDLVYDDQLSKRILNDELERLKQIKNHYLKIEKIILPYFEEKDTLSYTQKEKEVIVLLNKENKKKEEIISLLSLIEENIKTENIDMFPPLEENLSSLELLGIYIEIRKYDNCLIND